MSVHQPTRPSWFCRACPDEWPCVPARRHLLVNYDLAPRALRLSGDLIQAMTDLPDADAGVLYTRFLGWVKG